MNDGHRPADPRRRARGRCCKAVRGCRGRRRDPRHSRSCGCWTRRGRGGSTRTRGSRAPRCSAPPGTARRTSACQGGPATAETCPGSSCCPDEKETFHIHTSFSNFTIFTTFEYDVILRLPSMHLMRPCMCGWSCSGMFCPSLITKMPMEMCLFSATGM